MSEESPDPREVAWHPRYTPDVIGHSEAIARFTHSLGTGKLHHAWLIHGTKGIGKATLAYHFAALILGHKNPAQAQRWIASHAHPDLFVLERQLNDSKPPKLRTEISVHDARKLSEFFAHTSSSGWRVAIVDSADDLNAESANALLKLVEEPPANCVLLLVCNHPGRVLRTMKSRCMRLGLTGLTEAEVEQVVANLPLPTPPEPDALEMAVQLAGGSPGRALSLLTSEGAKSFDLFRKTTRWNPSTIVKLGNRFGGRTASVDDFNLFAELL
ncbi:MAG: hypothetical protein KGO94_11310, partial [Alphaproteobacteria bacterium]|nr:hypothetical protein [Alphaproteobacteria bacterium]